MKTNLTEAVKKYQEFQVDLKTVVDLIALAVYFYPPMRNRWDDDQCGEFLCYFYKRIPGMVERFKYRGSPFEALLKVSIQFQMKSFASLVKQKMIAERVLMNRDFWEKTMLKSELHNHTRAEIQPETAPIHPQTSFEEIRNNRGLKKRLLLLLLRESSRISESLLAHFTAITGYKREWIENKVEEVRKITFQLEGRRNICRHHRNQALFNSCCIHEELTYETEPEKREILLNKLDREKQNLRKSEESLNKIPKSPTHLQIAHVLGIPKGTVDSGLHYINKRFTP